MKTLYEAANSLDAHMLQDLLAQQGIHVLIHGEHLQGGAGDLPACGLVRLVVDDAEYAQARVIIDEWERSQPELAAEPARASAAGRHFGRGFLLGVALTGAAAWLLARTPIEETGVDRNGDGVNDEHLIRSVLGVLLRDEIDRNFDGRIDWIAYYDARGVITRVVSDDDFDGRFETETRYEQGNPAVTSVDSDGDGFIDLRTDYSHGVAMRNTYLSPVTTKPVRIEYLSSGRVDHAEIDTDGDGVLDHLEHYSRTGAVSSREEIPLP